VGAGLDREPGLEHERDRNHGAAVKVTLKTHYGRLEVEFTGHKDLFLSLSTAEAGLTQLVMLSGRDEIEAFRQAINEIWAATYGRDWQEK
jgi:hypothetical protein